jgi:dipeptidase D
VAGLRGGHSGGDIHENRGNAIKLLARTLQQTKQQGLRVSSLGGGSKRNVIPRDAEAIVAGPAGMLAALQSAAERVRDEAASQSREEKLAISVEPAGHNDTSIVLSVEDSERLLAVLAALPHGVLGLHPRMEGLVETSSNLATVLTNVTGGQMRVEVGTLARSSSESWLRTTLDQIAAVGELAGAHVEHGNAYPGWEPNVDSPTLATCRSVYERLFGESPKVTAIHAGLECGVIGERVGRIDMVSFGPRIEGAHSPDERVYVGSVEKSWQFLVAVLAELARPAP